MVIVRYLVNVVLNIVLCCGNMFLFLFVLYRIAFDYISCLAIAFYHASRIEYLGSFFLFIK